MWFMLALMYFKTWNLELSSIVLIITSMMNIFFNCQIRIDVTWLDIVFRYLAEIHSVALLSQLLFVDVSASQ